MSDKKACAVEDYYGAVRGEPDIEDILDACSACPLRAPREIPAAVRERYLEYRRVLLLGGDKNDIEILNAAVGEMEQTLRACGYDVKELER